MKALIKKFVILLTFVLLIGCCSINAFAAHKCNSSKHVKKEPTETESGLYVFICSCGNQREEIITPRELPTPKIVEIYSDDDGIHFSWEASENAEKYIIYKEHGDWEYAELATVGSDITSYVDQDIKPGYSYTYFIRVFSEDASSTSRDDENAVRQSYIGTTNITKVEYTRKGVDLSWSTAKGAKTYYVYRRQGNGSWKHIGSSQTENYLDKNVKYGYTYTYKVCGKSGSSSGLDSGEVVVPINTLHKVDNLKVKDVDAFDCYITWDKVVGAQGYYIYRSTSKDGTYEKIATVASSAEVKYRAYTSKSNVTYFYKIQSYYEDVLSEFSDVKSITFRIPTPEIKQYIPTTSKSIKLSFTHASDNDIFYVYRKTGTGSWKQIGTTKTDSYTDKSVKAGTKYSYSVTQKVTYEPDGRTSTSLRSDSVDVYALGAPSINVKQKGTKAAVNVSWGKVGYATKYVIVRKVEGNPNWIEVKRVGSATRSINVNVTPGKTTQFKVRAIREVGDHCIQGPYSSIKKCRFALPSLEYDSSTKYGSAVKEIKLKIRNRGKYTLRFYSTDAEIVNETNSSYNRKLKLVNSSGKKISYTDVKPGKTITLRYKIDGKSTRYNSKSIIGVKFRCDRVQYYMLSKPREEIAEVYVLD